MTTNDAYEALQKAEKKYRDFLENAVQGVFQVTREGSILYANPALATLFGFDSPQALMEMITDIGRQLYVNPEDRETYKTILESEGAIKGFEAQLLKKDASPMWVSISARSVRNDAGVLLYYEGTMEDISARKRAEEQLQLAYFSIEHVGLSAIWFDRKARVVHVNSAACQALGYTREALLQMTVHDFDPDVKSAADWNAIWEGIKASPDYFVFERPHRRKDGTIFPVEVVCSYFDYEGKEYIISFDRDITERNRAEAEKAKLEEQFQQAQKMESVGRLAGGVAHDLNNLLTPIMGYGEMLLGSFSENDGRKRSAEQIVRAGVRARDLVHQLLAFSRKQVLEFKSFDLNSAITGFEKLLRRAIREDIAIEINPDRGLPTLRGDIGQIEQVLMNLAVNAQDAMPEGGTLTIETGVTDLDAAYAAAHEGVVPGCYVLLAVSDTGEGMDAKTQAHLFEPFFTTKEKGKGTGLGLATVYGIVKQHGGNIWVYSEPGKGTTFKIYLPVPKTATGLVEAAPGMQTGDLSGTETILRVEDADIVRDLAHEILEHHGYTVLPAENGKAALEILQKHAGPVHLMLTDVVMPEMNGKELYVRAAAKHPELKVLYMSGYTENAIAHHGVLDDGVLLIQKPFSVQGLAAKVREALSKTAGTGILS